MLFKKSVKNGDFSPAEVEAITKFAEKAYKDMVINLEGNLQEEDHIHVTERVIEALAILSSAILSDFLHMPDDVERAHYLEEFESKLYHTVKEMDEEHWRTIFSKVKAKKKAFKND